MRDRSGVIFLAAVWITVILIMGYKCYRSAVNAEESINIKFKTLDEMIDGNH